MNRRALAGLTLSIAEAKDFLKKTSAWYTEIQYQLDVYDAYLAWLRTSRYNGSEDIGWALSVGHKQATVER